MSGRYRTIVADPPWDWPTGRSAPTSSWNRPTPGDLPYEPMRLDELAQLPVPHLAEPDAHLYLWTVNAFIERAYGLARSWGFRPVVLLTWCKTPRGLGLGGAHTQTTEHAIFCRRGSLRASCRVDSTWWNWPRGEHSRKPEAFLDLVEQVSPGPYLEMFARRQRLGWDTWGDEALEHVSLAAGVSGAD